MSENRPLPGRGKSRKMPCGHWRCSQMKAPNSTAARFARKELDYIAEMYCANYDIFHCSSLGGGRAKPAIAFKMKRQLLQHMADHLSATMNEKRTVMQIDQKIRDEVRQVKKYLRSKRQKELDCRGYPREIRLSSSQEYIASKLCTKPRLAGEISDPEKLFENGATLLAVKSEPLIDFAAAACSNSPELLLPPLITSTEPPVHSLEASLCSLSDYQRSKELDATMDTLEELQKEALRADIDCSRARTEAAIEERRYWEEKRNLLLLERQMLLERCPVMPNNEPGGDRLSSAVEERQFWEEKRKTLSLRRQCMIDNLEAI
ncbi:hypothetical protein Q1695_014545 [Nippostrongylus brasiliensis]|nr:hypothetical protein Q1695_014545 [Nippostrongylus brasiliensis]